MYAKDNRMISRSHNDPASKGENAIDCFHLFASWEHNGNYRAAAEALGMEKKTPQPTLRPGFTFKGRLAAIREWAITADFSQIIPTHLHSRRASCVFQAGGSGG